MPQYVGWRIFIIPLVTNIALKLMIVYIFLGTENVFCFVKNSYFKAIRERHLLLALTSSNQNTKLNVWIIQLYSSTLWPSSRSVSSYILSPDRPGSKPQLTGAQSHMSVRSGWIGKAFMCCMCRVAHHCAGIMWQCTLWYCGEVFLQLMKPQHSLWQNLQDDTKRTCHSLSLSSATNQWISFNVFRSYLFERSSLSISSRVFPLVSGSAK